MCVGATERGHETALQRSKQLRETSLMQFQAKEDAGSTDEPRLGSELPTLLCAVGPWLVLISFPKLKVYYGTRSVAPSTRSKNACYEFCVTVKSFETSFVAYKERGTRWCARSCRGQTPSCAITLKSDVP